MVQLEQLEGNSAYLRGLDDCVDILPPALAELNLPPLDAAPLAGGLQNAAAGGHDCTAAAQAAPQLPELGEQGLYGLDGDLESGLGSLLGGGDSWMGLKAHTSAAASEGQLPQRPFAALFT